MGALAQLLYDADAGVRRAVCLALSKLEPAVLAPQAEALEQQLSNAGAEVFRQVHLAIRELQPMLPHTRARARSCGQVRSLSAEQCLAETCAGGLAALPRRLTWVSTSVASQLRYVLEYP